MAPQLVFDVAKPGIELFGAAAIHRRERADHPVAASRHHQIDAGDEKHRRRDQRQAQAVAKACEEIGRFQRRFLVNRPGFAVPRPGFVVLASGNIGTTEGPRQNKTKQATKSGGGNISDPLYAFPTVCGQTLRALARYPSRVAFSWPGGSVSYAGATELIGRIQKVFMQLGLEPGARVAFLTANRADSWCAGIAAQLSRLSITWL